ncbi:MAG: hypothetical protein MUQ25_17375 [Candidatus Aminicenantes bacterium]|nr:hypothetical protein [Candidatus Aminicenantes bacterium]
MPGNAGRIRKDPKLSPAYEDDLEKRAKLQVGDPVIEKLALTAAHKRGMVVFVAGFAVMVFGILKYQWYSLPIAGVFMVIGTFPGIVGRLTSKEIGKSFVGITRQTAVFAFQLAEYINPVLPTSGVTMGVLGLAGLRWEKWAKWLVPLLVLWVLFGAPTLIPPVLTKRDPA